MTTFSTPRVSEFMMDIQSVSTERYEIAVQVRAMHFNCEPNLVEDIKYGGLVFIKDEELISGIFFYKQHISIEFGQGASLPDPGSVLEGKGKDRRHIKIRSLEEMATKNIADYVQAALAAVAVNKQAVVLSKNS